MRTGNRTQNSGKRSIKEREKGKGREKWQKREKLKRNERVMESELKEKVSGQAKFHRTYPKALACERLYIHTTWPVNKLVTYDKTFP